MPDLDPALLDFIAAGLIWTGAAMIAVGLMEWLGRRADDRYNDWRRSKRRPAHLPQPQPPGGRHHPGRRMNLQRGFTPEQRERSRISKTTLRLEGQIVAREYWLNHNGLTASIAERAIAERAIAEDRAELATMSR